VAPDQRHTSAEAAHIAPASTTNRVSGVEFMSTVVRGQSVAGRPPRVRDQARDAITVMAFSATTSAALAAALLLLSSLGR
jgi:hypothetical protein